MSDIEELEKKAFDVTYTRKMLMSELDYMIKKGWEISWFTTKNNSFSWEDINKDVEGFILIVGTLDFDRVDVGYFNPKEKKTEYECYEMNGNEM